MGHNILPIGCEVHSDPKERHNIALACHVHPTSGHLGVKKTIARVKKDLRGRV